MEGFRPRISASLREDDNSGWIRNEQSSDNVVEGFIELEEGLCAKVNGCIAWKGGGRQPKVCKSHQVFRIWGVVVVFVVLR